MKKRIAAILITILVLGFISYSFVAYKTSPTPEENEKITITDHAGREVEIPKKVDEIVATGPGALRYIAYLNATNKVVGIEQHEKTWAKKLPYNTANPELRELPSIGPPFGGDPSLITEIDPDIIFWRFANKKEANSLQQKTDIPVIVLSSGGPNGFWKNNTFSKSLNLMGKILNKEQRAKEIIKYMNKTIEDLEQRTKNIPETEKEPVYIGAVSWGKSTKGITSTMPKYPPFQFLNANNVAGNIGKRHASISSEMIIQWNPTKIFMDRAGYNTASKEIKSNTYNTVKAIKNDEIYLVWPYHDYEINLGLVLTDSYYIGKVIYPDQFKDVEIKQKSNEIFQKLFGTKLHKEMVENYGELEKIKQN